MSTTLTPVDWQLDRHPPTRDRSLRAFDAADVLALARLDSVVLPHRALVVNDGFGALAVPLVGAGVEVTVWTDSVLAEVAIRANLDAAGLDADRVGFSCTTVSVEPAADVGATTPAFDTVIVKVPKTLALLRHQLVHLRGVVSEGTTVIGAGMVRHIHSSTVDAFESIIGPTVTSLATRKARLIHPSFDPERRPDPPSTVRYRTEAGIDVVSRVNVFSQTTLDIGTRLLLDNLPTVPDGADLLDLGCGNGVVGATLAATFRGGTITFTDVSHAAVASARDTWAANDGDDRARFLAVDLAEGVGDGSVDIVVVNPPFHDQHVVGDETARRMFADARRVLRPGGEIRVVGNRHLGYHRRLKERFAAVQVVASNPKFVVLSGRKPGS